MMYGFCFCNVNPILEDLLKEILENRLDTTEAGL